MKVIYTRTMRVKDDGLGKAMEIGKGLAAVRKKHYPNHCLLYTSPSPRDGLLSRMPSSA